MAGEIHQFSSSTVTDLVAPQNELLQTLGHWIPWWMVFLERMNLARFTLFGFANSLAALQHILSSFVKLAIAQQPEQRGKAKARLSAPWSPMKLPQQWLTIHPNMTASYQQSGPAGQKLAFYIFYWNN